MSSADVPLDQLYEPPSELIQKGVLPHLMPFHVTYLNAARFFCLATGRAEGLDASPRGGPAGFVRVLDSKTVFFADWPGNNRIESMRNLVQDERLALLFLFPGLDVFLRIHGRGRVSTEPELLARVKEGEKTPKTAIVVTVDEVLFHCGKAINRARLWAPESQIDRKALPTVGQLMTLMTGAGADQAEAIDAHYLHSVRHDLY